MADKIKEPVLDKYNVGLLFFITSTACLLALVSEIAGW